MLLSEGRKRQKGLSAKDAEVVHQDPTYRQTNLPWN